MGFLWLQNNLANLAVLVLIGIAVFFALRHMVRIKKAGKCSCGSCGSDCRSCSACRPAPSRPEQEANGTQERSSRP